MSILRLVWIGLLVAACSAPASGPAAPGPAATAAPMEQRDDAQVVSVGVGLLPAYLTPQVSTTQHVFLWPLYDNLTQFGANFEVRPSIAQRWELSADRLTWTFVLRPDVTFSDGSPLTAEDVEYTISQAIEQAWPQRAFLGNVSQVRAIDKATVAVTTRTPDITIPSAGSPLFIVPKRLVEVAGMEAFRQKPVGSGPYELVEFKAGDVLHLKKRQSNHAFRKPIPNELVFRLVPDSQQLVNGMQTGQFDLISGTIASDRIERLRSTGFGVTTKPESLFSLTLPQGTYEMNNTPLRNVNVRRALNYAVNRVELTKAIYGPDGIPVGQLAVPHSQYWDDTAQTWPYDPAKAKQLLAEAGYPNGFKLTMDYTPPIAPQEVPLGVQANLAQVGVEVEIRTLASTAFADAALGRNNAVKGDISPLTLGETNGLAQYPSVGCGRPFGAAPSALYYCNPERERIYGEALQEPDAARRRQLLVQANRLQVADAPVIFMHVRPAYFVTSPKLRGLDIPISNQYNVDAIYKVK